MTRSELMASMSGSLACIAGSIMAVYIQLGVSATYLLTASLMAAPGALVIAKMMLPETERTLEEKMQPIELDEEAHQSVNVIDAAAKGASDGMKIGLQVATMLIAFISLIALVDVVLASCGQQLVAWGANLKPMGIDLAHLSLQQLLSIPFSGIAVMLGVPFAEAAKVGGLLGTKLVTNEFVAYQGYLGLQHGLSLKAQAIASVALCGFANFGSVAMQIGGIGEMAPNRKADLAQLGLKALVAGSLASYMSAAIVGMLL
jgi:CNT family concentrative nucleoside transporter